MNLRAAIFQQRRRHTPDHLGWNCALYTIYNTIQKRSPPSKKIEKNENKKENKNEKQHGYTLVWQYTHQFLVFKFQTPSC